MSFGRAVALSFSYYTCRDNQLYTYFHVTSPHLELVIMVFERRRIFIHTKPLIPSSTSANKYHSFAKTSSLPKFFPLSFLFILSQTLQSTEPITFPPQLGSTKLPNFLYKKEIFTHLMFPKWGNKNIYPLSSTFSLLLLYYYRYTSRLRKTSVNTHKVTATPFYMQIKRKERKMRLG